MEKTIPQNMKQVTISEITSMQNQFKYCEVKPGDRKRDRAFRNQLTLFPLSPESYPWF